MTKGIFYNAEETSRENSKCSDWLVQFAEAQATKQVSAVEVARQRASAIQPSVTDLMSSVISGSPSKFSSVEEVVSHYQERTGLGNYLQQKKAEQLKAAAHSIISNAQAPEKEEELVVSTDMSDVSDDPEERASEFEKLLSDFQKAQEDYNSKMDAVEKFIEQHTPIFGKVQKQLDKLKGKGKEKPGKRKKKAEFGVEDKEIDEVIAEAKAALQDFYSMIQSLKDELLSQRDSGASKTEMEKTVKDMLKCKTQIAILQKSLAQLENQKLMTKPESIQDLLADIRTASVDSKKKSQ